MSAVFLSYASQDADAAQRICDALRATGVEVWFDRNELVGGDAWDTKIRRQIRECALFVPILSATTQSRGEGYFRLEWKLAVDRSHLIARDQPFLVPVVVDDTAEAGARVPEEFLAVQWTRLRPVGSGGLAPDEAAVVAFSERVRRLLSGPAPAKVTAPVPTASRPVATAPRGRRTMPVVVGLVAATGIAIAIWRPWREPVPPAALPASLPQAAAAPAAGAPAAAPANSVAVLAFANMSADKENTEYFSDGVSEEILNALDRIPSLQVTPRTSSFSFKDRNVPLDEIGRTLRVASVIEGSVRKAGNEVRITVKLINATSGARVWVEEFTREMTPANIFAVQSEIATMVARKLSGAPASPTAVAAAATGTQTKNSAAYDAYLRARALQTSGLSAENGRDMVRLFEEAVRFDPDYALAWAGLAQARVRMRSGGRDRSDQNAERARQAAMTALRLAPNLPEAHVAMARVHFYVGYDLDAAQRAIDETERLRPNDAEVPAFRVTLAQARGIWGEELSRLVARAVESDPQNADRIYLLGQTLTSIGRFAAAEQLYERARTISPTDSQYRRLAQNHLAWTGDTARASAIYDLAGSGSPVFQSDRARLRASHGDLAGAIAQFEWVIAATEANSTTRSDAAFRAALLERRRNNSARAQALLDLALVAAKEALRALPNDYYATVLLPCIHAARGETADARAALADLERLAMERNSANPLAAGGVYAAEALALMGEADAAIAKLRALHEKGRGFGYALRLDSEWEPLRRHPKFQQLMKEAEARADAQPRPKR